MAKSLLQARDKTLNLNFPHIMGVLNRTPDSFSDGGHFFSLNLALERCYNMIEEGASIIDIGGESSRPGAQPVSEQEELDRVIPLIESLSHTTDIIISVDTVKPAIMQAAVQAGVHIINDIKALQTAGALEVIQNSSVAVCLMHMQGEPAFMQQNPNYTDVVTETSTFLSQQVSRCDTAGISMSRLIIDPGFGFGKSYAHNVQLLKNLDQFSALGLPILVGLSRKAMIGKVLPALCPEDRVHASIALAILALQKGARVFRCHDVKAHYQAIKMAFEVEASAC